MPPPLTRPSSALRIDQDPRVHLRHLDSLFEQWSSTGAVPTGVREEVARSWQRQPAHYRGADYRPADEVARRRDADPLLNHASAALRERLLTSCTDTATELVLCDSDGVVLWVAGPPNVRKRSENLGFVEGASWTEKAVGTNALGTAMADRSPVQIFGSEHAHPSHHSWVCTGAPIIDPRDESVLGAITLSGGLRTAHPHTLSLVCSTLDAVNAELRMIHQDGLRGRSDAASGLLGPPGADSLVVDGNGWVIATRGIAVSDRLFIPGGLASGTVWIPSLGHFDAQAVGDLWQLRRATRNATSLILQAEPPCALVSFDDQEQATHPLTRRQFDLLRILAAHPAGLSARELATKLYGGGDHTVTVRAEVSRIRRSLGPLLAQRPYRLTVPASCR
ncbi:helix-turn-helix domain-containing protein [Williamsia soli]|uniref:helix-turn-helix domain-containing protein n=1 Tax=Williamsia soli TaxID=364929 RepID=UPI001A9E9E6B|nr:helix-turn-helix domain-containing protein [Williamsia soli]